MTTSPHIKILNQKVGQHPRIMKTVIGNHNYTIFGNQEYTINGNNKYISFGNKEYITFGNKECSTYSLSGLASG